MRSLAAQLYDDVINESVVSHAPTWDQIVPRAFARLRTVYNKLRRAMSFLLGQAADAVIPPFVNERKRAVAAKTPAIDTARAGSTDASVEVATSIAYPSDQTLQKDARTPSTAIADVTPSSSDAPVPLGAAAASTGATTRAKSAKWRRGRRRPKRSRAPLPAERPR